MSLRSRGSRHITRRRLIQAGIALGAGAKLVSAAMFGTKPVFGGQAGLLGPGNFYRGMCYGGGTFPAPYSESIANSTCIFFGSDVAYDPMTPLWGPSYTTNAHSTVTGRNDLQTMSSMSVNLIRLYDWDPRNPHLNFLDACQALNMKVLAPVSNYFLEAPGAPYYGGYPNKGTNIPALIKSFGNRGGTDYHPAIAGIIIGNEPKIGNKFPTSNLVDFTNEWVNAESTLRFNAKPMIGHPVDFGTYGQVNPGWVYWDELVPGLGSLGTRLFLAMNTTNPGRDLFENFAGQGKGWVELTYEKYKKAILFTEISVNRLDPGYMDTIRGQLSGAMTYDKANPGQLLGTAFFEFADKVWVPGTTEGSFGAYSHGGTSATASYNASDFTHNDVPPGPAAGCDGQQLTVDKLTPNPIADTVQKIYSGVALSAAPTAAISGSPTATSTTAPSPASPTSTPSPAAPSATPRPATPTSTPSPVAPTATPSPAPPTSTPNPTIPTSTPAPTSTPPAP